MTGLCSDGVKIIVDPDYYREMLRFIKVVIMSKLPAVSSSTI